jgi:hypothetical protein
LASTEWAYDQDETLSWSDLYVKYDSVLIRVKISSSGLISCPVKCLHRLKGMCENCSAAQTSVISLGNVAGLREIHQIQHPGTYAETPMWAPSPGTFRVIVSGRRWPSAMANSPDMFNESKIKLFSFFICFWRTSGSFFVIFSSVAPLRDQPAAKCHPKWQPTRRLAVSCGEAGFEPGTAGQQSGALPLRLNF